MRHWLGYFIFPLSLCAVVFLFWPAHDTKSASSKFCTIDQCIIQSWAKKVPGSKPQAICLYAISGNARTCVVLLEKNGEVECVQENVWMFPFKELHPRLQVESLCMDALSLN